MIYFKVNDGIYDEHLRLLRTMDKTTERLISEKLRPLNRREARHFMIVLWMETYALSRKGPVPRQFRKIPRELNMKSYDIKCGQILRKQAPLPSAE
jgi:hypothetical protein